MSKSKKRIPWDFEKSTNTTHVNLVEKLICCRATTSLSKTFFARELATVIVPTNHKDYPYVDTVDAFSSVLVERLKQNTQQPKTLTLIEGCSKLADIKCDSTASIEALAQMPLEEWVLLFDEENRDTLVRKINEIGAEDELVAIGRRLGLLTQKEKPMSAKKSADIHGDLLPVYTNLGQFKQSFDSDDHDLSEIQKFMYFDSGAVAHWATLIASADKNYPNYLNCKNSLDTFLNHDYWKDLLKSNQIYRTINLGAGTPEKDRAIIGSSIDSQEHNRDALLPTHYVIDSSMYMLLNTVKKLCYSNIYSRKITDNDIISVAGDFMTLSKLIPCCNTNKDGNSTRRSVFFLLGGTIGNINPQRFIDSVNGVAARGDLLIISAEFRPDTHEDIEQFKSNTTRHYNHKNAKQLVVPAVRSVLKSRKYAHLNSHTETDDVIISRLTATANTVSHTGKRLPNSLKIIFRYEHLKTAFNVVEASRYVEKEFIEFITGEGFSYINSFGKNYPKQIVFEKL